MRKLTVFSLAWIVLIGNLLLTSGNAQSQTEPSEGKPRHFRVMFLLTLAISATSELLSGAATVPPGSPLPLESPARQSAPHSVLSIHAPQTVRN